MEKEEKLKKEVVELFNKLEEERNGIFDYSHGKFSDPNPQTFVKTFNEMYGRCKDLNTLDSDKYDLNKLSHTKEKELVYVDRFEYKYDNYGEKTNKSKNELTGLMKVVIDQVKIDIPQILN